MDVTPGTRIGRHRVGSDLNAALADCIARGLDTLVEDGDARIELRVSNADGSTVQLWFDGVTHRSALVRWTFAGVLPCELRVAQRVLGKAGEAVSAADVDARLGSSWPTEQASVPGLWVSEFSGMALGFRSTAAAPAKGKPPLPSLILQSVWVHAAEASALRPKVPRLATVGNAQVPRRAGGAPDEQLPERASAWLRSRIGSDAAASQLGAALEVQARSGLRGLCGVLHPADGWAMLWFPGRGSGAWLAACGDAVAASSEDDALAALGAPGAIATARPMLSSLARADSNSGAGATAGGSTSPPAAPRSRPSCDSSCHFRCCCWSAREGVDLLFCPVRRCLIGMAATTNMPGHRDFGSVARASFALLVADEARPAAGVAGAAAAAAEAGVPREPSTSDASSREGASPRSEAASRSEDDSVELSDGSGSSRSSGDDASSDDDDRTWAQKAAAAASVRAAPPSDKQESDRFSTMKDAVPRPSAPPSEPRAGPAAAAAGTGAAAAGAADLAARQAGEAPGPALAGWELLTSESRRADWAAVLGKPLRPVQLLAPAGALAPSELPSGDIAFEATTATVWGSGVMVECCGDEAVARLAFTVGLPL